MFFSTGKGPQGATGGNVDYLDASKSPIAGGGSDTGSPRPGSATSPLPQGPRQQKPASGQQKKKKKKGARR